MAKKYLGFAAVLLLLAGCSNNDFTDNGANVPESQLSAISTINAMMDNADTRLYLNENEVRWKGNETIYVFSDIESANWYEYKLSTIRSDMSAEFAGDAISGTEFYALHPKPTAVDGTARTATIPWKYEILYDKMNTYCSFPIFAKSRNSNMLFKQLGGLLHLTIYGKGILKTLTLKGNNNEGLYNYYDLNFADDDLELTPNTNLGMPISDISLVDPQVFTGDLTLSEEEPLDIYFILPAGLTFEKGFTISGTTEVEDLETATHSFVPFEQKTTDSFTVKRAEMANFPAFSTTGIMPTPEPVNGWISNFFDFSGTEAGAYCYIINGKVDWQFAFFVDNESEEGPKDVLAIEFFTDYTGGAPTLSWLEGTDVQDLEASRFHGPDGNIYRIGDSSGFKVKRNPDGTWSLSVEDATVYNNNASSEKMEGIYLKFRGKLTGNVPETAWTISGGLDFGGNEASVYADVTSSKIYWNFTFADLDEDDNMKRNMLLSFETPYEGQTPSLSMLENFETADFSSNMHDFTNGGVAYWRSEGDKTKLTITKSDKADVWTISYNGMAVENNDGAVSGGVNFKFEGKLTLPPQPTWSFSGDASMDD
ncbi:MAG: hypothetical protein J6U14_10930 [Bacteroidaceae bacterium]|nr:hypothetical protein [Bacteroidaceae bacterium]